MYALHHHIQSTVWRQIIYADPTCTLSSLKALGCVKDKKTMLAFCKNLSVMSLAPVSAVNLKLLYVEVHVPMGVRLGDEFADELIAWLCFIHMYVKQHSSYIFFLLDNEFCSTIIILGW